VSPDFPALLLQALIMSDNKLTLVAPTVATFIVNFVVSPISMTII
jgi:hypothetical protein